jgi:ankyrin repeat protein
MNGRMSLWAVLVVLTLRMSSTSSAAETRRDRPVLPSPLHLAAMKGPTNEVARLLAEGAEVNARDRDNGTPLHWAVRSFQNAPAIVAQLLTHGANVNAQDRNGATPIHLVVANRGAAEIIDLLVDEGADVNAKARRGETPLHWAASQGMLHSAKALLVHGADTSAKDKMGKTPLDYARSGEMKTILLRTSTDSLPPAQSRDPKGEDT